MQGKMKNIPARDRIEDDSTIALGVSLFAWLLHQLGLVKKERRIMITVSKNCWVTRQYSRKYFIAQGKLTTDSYQIFEYTRLCIIIVQSE